MKPRAKKGKPSGGQAGHQGHTLLQVERPDQVVAYRPERCEACSYELGGVPGEIHERRQIYELPEMRMHVIEHQVQAICCPVCQQRNAAHFPVGVDAPTQYGPRMQALAVYLSQFQLLPMERLQELCRDVLGCHLSEGTRANWLAQAAKTLEPSMQHLKDLLGRSRVMHADETGARIKGILHWVHVVFHTHICCHPP